VLRGGARSARVLGVAALILLALKLIADLGGSGAIVVLPPGIELAAGAPRRRRGRGGRVRGDSPRSARAATLARTRLAATLANSNR